MDGQIEGRKLVLGFLHHSKSVTSSEDPQLRDQLLKRTHAINLHIWYVLNGQNWGNLSSSSRSPDSTLVMDGQVKEPLRLSQFYFSIIQKSIISLVHLVSESNICRFFCIHNLRLQQEQERCENWESSNWGNFWRRLPLENGLFSLGKQFHGRLKTAGW